MFERLGLVTIQPCEMNAECAASLQNRGEAALCGACIWSEESLESSRDCFRPLDKRTRFPRREKAQYDARKQKNADRREVKLSKDKSRTRLGRKAASAEKLSERNIIKSTRNSGRTNKDGDHIAAGSISLDTKLQTGNLHPIVNLDQLDKIRMDARRAGNPIGALILRNRNNRGVVVLAEEDWARLVTRLTE